MVAQTPIPAKIISDDQLAIKQLLDALQKNHSDDVMEVILFGSKARGDSHSDSDIDILVLVQKENWSLRNTIWSLAATIELAYENIIFNVQVIGLRRWEQMMRENFSLCQNISRDGIVLLKKQ